MKIVFMLLFFCTLFKANDVFAQTNKVSTSHKGTINRAAGEKMDELLARYAMYGFSGTVLVVKNNRIVIHKAYGLADRETGRPNTVETLYDVGSIAKTFTATAILQMEMQGKLKTDDLISKYLGEIPADKAGITIHHLLTHTAGLKLDAGDVGINPTTAPDEFLRKAKDAPLLSAPGEKYNYSNLGYGLLAMIVEKVSGLSWQNYLKKNILKPAGLSRTALYGDAVTPDKLARGYIGDGEENLKLEEPLKLERQDSLVWRKYTLGAVGVITTTGDLYKWWQALHSSKILSAEARRKMFSVQAANQGYGWNIQTTPENTRTYRGGLRGSYQSLLAYYPQENAILIFVLNKNNTEIASLWLSVAWKNLENAVLGKDYAVPPAVLPVAPTNLGRYAGEYELPSGERFVVWTENNRLYVGARGQTAVNHLAFPHQKAPPPFLNEVGATGKQVVEWLSKNDSSQIKDSGFISEKNLPVLQTRWKSWMETVGELKSFQILGVSPGLGSDPRTMVFVRLNGEKSSLVVRLIWNWEQRRLAAWGYGDNITLPAITKLLPESETSFVNFNFDKSQLLRIRFDTSSDGKVTGLTVRSSDGKSDVAALKTDKPQTGSN